MLSPPNYAVLISVLAGMVSIIPCKAEEPINQDTNEAKALFGVVKADLRQDASHRCSILASWSQIPISREIAKRRLGITVQADLIAPHRQNVGTSPAQILDIANAIDGAYCDQAELNAFKAEQRSAATAHQQPTALQMNSYSFPVFGSNYSKAAFVLMTSYSGWSLIKDTYHQTGLTWVSVFVYEKSRGHWKRVAEDVVATP